MAKSEPTGPRLAPQAAHARAGANPPQREPARERASLQSAVGNRGMQQLLGDVRRLIGEGTPLPAALRAQTEARFGADLGGVRIHDHGAAHALAQQHLARAFTLGTDIVFNRGRYQPGCADGRHLLAHELTHVVQQTRGGPAAPAGRVHEEAADQAAFSLADGGSGPVDPGPSAAVGVQCTPLSEAEIQLLTLARVRDRLAENEKEAAFMMASEAYKELLAQENLRLKDRAAAFMRQDQASQLSGTAGPPSLAKGADAVPSSGKVMEAIEAELAALTPLVNRLAFNVPLNLADHALNEVRNLDAMLRSDEKAVREFEAVAAGKAGEVHATVIRFQVLVQMMAPAVAAATTWHDANPAGESLGMMNERAGVWLAGAGSEQWEKGGLHYVPGALAYVGAFGVAFVDAGEKVASMGFHDAATAVSEAYTRGDISWNEGEKILKSAAWRALLTAAVTRGAGMATRGLGVLGAEATGLASTTLRYGAVAGAIPGGLSATAALGTQALLTKGLEDQFKSPAAKAIWNQGMPQGKDWAIAIPLGIVMGGLGGMRGVEIGNDKLVGTIIDTPEGPMQVMMVTKLKITMNGGKLGLTEPGVMVLKPVGGSLALVPPPPVADLVMVFDPVTNSWGYPQTPPTGLAAVRRGGGALVPIPKTGNPLVVNEATAGAVAGVATGVLPGTPPKPALPISKPMKALPAAKTPDALAVQADAAVPSTPVVIPPAPKLPVTANTLRAAQRLAQTEAALASANQSANLARAEVAKAQGDLAAANELAAEAGGGKDAKALVKGAEADLRRAVAALKPLERSEAVALRERDAVARGGTGVARIELELAELDEQINDELHKTRFVIPPTGTSEGRAYHRLADKRANALRRLQAETKGLSRSLSDQVSAATPGASARATALANAAQLDPALHPVNGMPIDVTSGRPMTSQDWATDHIMSRSEIASDPRFARLTPLQRDAMLLAVPENYLPLTIEANSSKLNLPVPEWIVKRAGNGKPLSPETVQALRSADQRARAAIEAMFIYFLPP